MRKNYSEKFIMSHHDFIFNTQGSFIIEYSLYPSAYIFSFGKTLKGTENAKLANDLSNVRVAVFVAFFGISGAFSPKIVLISNSRSF